MENIQLIITDKINFYDDKCTIIDNPTHIPRIGERISWIHESVVMVKDVIHDYDNNKIYVVVE